MSDSLDELQDSGVDIFLILKNFFYLFRRTFYFVILAAAALGALSGYRAYRSYRKFGVLRTGSRSIPALRGAFCARSAFRCAGRQRRFCAGG